MAGLGLLCLSLRDVDFGRMVSIVSSVSYRYLLLAVLLDGVVFVIKATKWRYIVLRLKRLPLWSFFSGIAVGAMCNNLLPLRLDEVVRTFYFSTRGGVPKATVLGTIVIERLVDATTLLLAIGVVLWIRRGQGFLFRSETIAIVAVIAIGLAILTVAVRRVKLARVLERLIPVGHAKAKAVTAEIVANLRAGLDAFPVRGRLVGVFGFAFAEWLVTVLYVRVVLGAFGVSMPLWGCLLLTVVGYLSFAIPSAPGGLGVFELLVKTSLVIGFGMDADTAMSYAVTMHFLLVVPISLVGVACLLADGISVSEFGGLRRREAPARPAVSTDADR